MFLEKKTYIIWKKVKHEHGDDVIGIYFGTYKEADDLLDKMNRNDETVTVSLYGPPLYGYYRTEPDLLTDDNKLDFITK